MNIDQWEQLKETLEQKFDTYENWKDTGPEDEDLEYVEFDNERGRFQLVWESRPKILEKKQHYSHRPGDTAHTEYITSNSETTSKLKIYKDIDGEWEEIKITDLGIV